MPPACDGTDVVGGTFSCDGPLPLWTSDVAAPLPQGGRDEDICSDTDAERACVFDVPALSSHGQLCG